MNVARARDTHAEGTAELLGLLSVGAGAALLVAPKVVTELFALPRRAGVGRALALRDLAVGVLLLVPRTRPLGLHLRALSDATDAALAGSETLRGERPLQSTAITMLGGLALSALSARLAGRAQAGRTRGS